MGVAALPVLLWDTTVPAPDAFDVFNDATRSIQHRVPVKGSGIFNVDATDYLLDDLVVSRIAYDEHTITRTATQVAPGESDCIAVQMHLVGSVRGAVGDVEMYAGPDRVVIQDLAHPFTVWAERSDVIGVVIPRQRVGCHDWIRNRAPVITFPLDSPTGRILGSALMTLWNQLPHASMDDGPALAGGFVGLVNGLLQPSPETDDDVRRALAAAMKQYIRANLDDLNLGADELRARFYCSRSTMYRIFEDDGGVASYIRDLRLRACLHDLAEPGSQPRTRVSRIATRWGFENPSHFNRLFKKAFGVAPSAVAIRQESDRALAAADVDEAAESMVTILNAWLTATSQHA